MADLQWQNTAPGLYERSLDDSEIVLNAIVGKPVESRLNWTLTTAIKIRLTNPVQDTEDYVREAWKTLRHDCPSVASWVDADAKKKFYTIGNDEELNSWLQNTFLVDRSGRSARDLVPDLPTAYDRIILIFLPQSMEIVLRSNHVMIDGYGVQMLLSNLCQILAHPRSVKFGDEAIRLSPPLKVAADIGKPSPEYEESTSKMFIDWATGGNPPVSLAVKEGSEQLPPGAPRMTSLVLTSEETQNLKAAAKKQGFTLTHIFQAAVAVATRDIGVNQDGHWSGLLGFSLRSRCKKPFDGPEHAVALDLTGVAFVLNNPTDVISCASEVRRIIEPLKADPLYPTTVEPLAKTLLSLLAQAPPPPPGLCKPYFSNLGIIDERLSRSYGEGKLEVVDFFNTVDHVLPEIVVNTWTFGDKLTISSGFNEVYHTEESIQKYLQYIKKIVFEALKI